MGGDNGGGVRRALRIVTITVPPFALTTRAAPMLAAGAACFAAWTPASGWRWRNAGHVTQTKTSIALTLRAKVTRPTTDGMLSPFRVELIRAFLALSTSS